MKLGWLLCFLLGVGAMQAQTVIYVPQDFNPGSDSAEEDKEVVSRYATYFAAGVALGSASPEFQLKLPFMFRYGFRLSRSVAGPVGLGVDAAIHWGSYAMKQNSMKTLPDTHRYARETLDLFSLDVAGLVQFPARAKAGGLNADIGVGVRWVASLLHQTRTNNPNGSITKSRTTRLPYRQPFQPFVLARVSVSRFSVWATYQLASSLRQGGVFTGNEQLPALEVGIQVNLVHGRDE